MRTGTIFALTGAIAAATALPNQRLPLERRQNAVATYSIVQTGADSQARQQEVSTKQATFLYGPSVGGNNSWYPSGSLGNATAAIDIQTVGVTATQIKDNVTADAGQVLMAVQAHGGIATLDDYQILYRDQWQRSVPGGPYAGFLTNYTNDLLFSMARLSVNPYSLVRLDSAAPLPFTMDDGVARDRCSQTLGDLHQGGNLFYVNYSSLASLPVSSGKYVAGTEAYFYIDPRSSDFLPLAIKFTSATSNLVYTPADSTSDWLFAKMMFNLNDVWQAAWYHFASSHFVLEIVYEAAIRSFSEQHPIMAIMRRISLQAFAFRPLAAVSLYAPGAYIEQLFPWNGSIASLYTDSLYWHAAGAVQANYFSTNLEARGLAKTTRGRNFKSFPFYEDASVIHKAQHSFFSDFVKSYYDNDKAIEADPELQTWLKEANGPAGILNFPSIMKDRKTVIDLLTHLAYLVSIVHQTLNTDVPVHSTATLPFNPMSFYKPLPTEKGLNEADLVAMMPNVTQSVAQIALLANFNRASFAGTNLTLSNMFSDDVMLAKMNDKTRKAADQFKSKMLDLSKLVQKKAVFDENGLSRGMPFLWNGLDPEVAPFFLSV